MKSKLVDRVCGNVTICYAAAYIKAAIGMSTAHSCMHESIVVVVLK